MTTTVWTKDPATQIPEYSGRVVSRRNRYATACGVCRKSRRACPPPPGRYCACVTARGARGLRVCGGAGVGHARPEPGPPVWLLLRRPVGGVGEVKYYVSNASAQTALAVLALVSGCRLRVEEHFEDSKGYLGMGHYECRSWTGWHHHMTLVALAHLLVTGVRRRLKKSERADPGYGGAAAEGCLASTGADRRGRLGHRSVSPASQRMRTPFPHEDLETRTPRDQTEALMEDNNQWQSVLIWENNNTRCRITFGVRSH